MPPSRGVVRVAASSAMERIPPPFFAVPPHTCRRVLPLQQGIICKLNRNGNFCKEIDVGKIVVGAEVDARVVQQKSPLVFLACLQWQIC